MGYGFYGYKRKTDEDYIITTQCQYAYQLVFQECFGKDISEFDGRVTKQKILEFENGLMKFISDPVRYNRDSEMFRGYIDNNRYENLCQELLSLLEVMKSKQVQYLSIG